MNRFVLIVVLLFLGVASFGQRIAVIDSDSVLVSMPEYDFVQDILEKQGQDYQQIYDSLVTDFQKLYQKLLTEIQYCSLSKMRELKKKLVIEQQFIFWFQNVGSKRILNSKKKLLKIVRTKFYKNSKQFLLEKNYDFLIEKDSIIFFHTKSDRTQQMIDRLKTRSEEVLSIIFLQLKKEAKHNDIKWTSNLGFIKKGLELELLQVTDNGTLKYDLKIKTTLRGCKDKIYGFRDL